MTSQIKASDASRHHFDAHWHYRPDTPIQSSPLFQWPLRPLSIWHWFAARWLAVGENTVLVVLALVSWVWLQPPLAVTTTLSIDWIATLYMRNLALMITVAGGLHWYFYRWQRQGQTLRHDERDLGQGRQFTFGNQVRDNVFWTLASGVHFLDSL